VTVPEQPNSVSDGAAEITRQQQAQDFELPEVGAPKADAPVPFASLPTSPFGIIDEQRPRHREESAPSPKALEDLYASCPQVGRGDWKIRVTRTSPPSFRGCATAGYLGEFFERMSMDEFAQKFGGGRYIVAVMRPVSSATGATQSDYKQVKDVKFRVPGDPTLEGIATTSNEDEAVRFDPRNFGMPSEKVEVTRLQIARERERELAEDRRRMEERLQAERDQRGSSNGGSQPSFEALDHYNQTVQRAWGDVKEQNHAQLAFWQQEVERLRATEAAQLEEIRSLRERLMRAETEAANTSRQIETSGMREMRERFDERHNDLRESHSRSTAELKERYEEDRRRVLEENQRKNEQTVEDHRSQVDEMTRRYQEERRGYESGQNLERERQREDARHRIDQVERAKEIEVRQLRETQESRLEDLRRASERELTAIREQTAREVASVRESERVQSTLVKEMAGGKIDLAQRDSDRARADAERRVAEMEKRLSEARTHNSDLLQQTHKEPLQALQEAQEMSRWSGMVHPSEVDTGGGEAPPSSLADQLVGLARGVVEKVPEILEKVAHNRVQNQEQAERARAHLAQQQQFRQQQIQRQQQERQAPTRQLAAAPPAAPSPAAYQEGAGAAPFGAPPQYSPLPIGAASFGAVTPPPLGAHPPMVSSPLQPAVEGLPIQEGAQEPVEQEALPPPAEQEAAAEPHAEGTPDAPTPLDGESVTLFFTELDSAIAGKTITPELFADGIVGRIGAEATRELLEKFAMSDVVETARQISADSAIVTRHGRRYVRALWAVAASKVGATPAS